MTEETSRKHEAVLGEQEMIMMSNNTTTTEEQVLAWLIEKLTLQGAVGLFTDWLPEHFSSIWTIEVNPSDPFSDFTTEGFDLMACLDHSIREHSREEWLGQITTQNSSLYPRVVKLVESKLLARGISQERLQSLTPREKLIMLAEADLLRAPPQAKFILYLITAAKDVKGNNTRESTKLFFPHTTAFTHFQAVLRDFTLPSAIRTGRTTGYTLLDGPWIYRLIGPNKAIIPGLPKYSIADETDFREMKRRLQNKDTPTACIFHSLVGRLFEERIESHAPKVAREEMVPDEGDEDEVLDENGEPYFEKNIDWKSFIKIATNTVGGSKSMPG